MSACPVCFGEGLHDFTDSDAFFFEHLTDEEIARNHVVKLGIVSCEECEGTGHVSAERAREITAAAVAAIDQVVARLAVSGPPFRPDTSTERNPHD